MLKFFRANSIRIWVFQLILSLLVLVLGILATNFSLNEYYPFIAGRYIHNLITFVVLALSFPVYKLISNKNFKKLKSSFIFLSIFYLISFLPSLGISIILDDRDIILKEPYSLLHFIFQCISTIIVLFLWVIFTVLFWVVPAYKTEEELKQLKSKTSKDAAEKIMDLKKLLDEGIISKEVFDEKSKKYIEEL
jgi:uncharacterized protein YacL